RGHDLAGLAVAALWNVERQPSLLHRVRGVGGQALDGDDLVGRLHIPDADRAGAHDLAVDMDGAGAALRNTATVLGTGETDLLADDPQKRGVRLHLHVTRLPIDVESCH